MFSVGILVSIANFSHQSCKIQYGILSLQITFSQESAQSLVNYAVTDPKQDWKWDPGPSWHVLATISHDAYPKVSLVFLYNMLLLLP